MKEEAKYKIIDRLGITLFLITLIIGVCGMCLSNPPNWLYYLGVGTLILACICLGVWASWQRKHKGG